MNMGRWVRAVCWTVAFLMLLDCLYLWGGLALTRPIGPKLREQASVSSPLAATYLFLGRHAVQLAGMQDRAQARVAEDYADVISDTTSAPQTLVRRVLAAQSAGDRLNYYGAPLMLVLSLVLHARRQRRIRSFGVRD